MVSKKELKPIIDILPKNVKKAILCKDRRNRNFIIVDDPNKEIDIEQMKKIHKWFYEDPLMKRAKYNYLHMRIKDIR